MGHSQPYHPGPQHWAGLIVDALEVLLTDSCLCLESVPLAQHLVPSPCLRSGLDGPSSMPLPAVSHLLSPYASKHHHAEHRSSVNYFE